MYMGQSRVELERTAKGANAIVSEEVEGRC